MIWDDLHVFLALHRTGTYAAAARTLGVDATTIGRRIDALQASMGSALFERSARGLALTESGKKLLPRAERVDAEILAATRELSGRDARIEGPVRLTASDGIVDAVLLPNVAELRRAQPDLELTIHSEARNVDLSRREADLAVRLSRPKEKALVVRRLGTLRFGLFASSDYLARHGAPRSVTDFAGHTWVGFEPRAEGSTASRDASASVPQARWLEKTFRIDRYAVRVSTTAGARTACACGLGVALLPTFAMNGAGAPLVRLLPRLETPAREIWSVVHRDVQRMARVVVVSEWLRRVFSAASGHAQ